MDNLLFETVVPILLLTHKDHVLFRDDPIEFIRKQQDFTETMYHPRGAVVDLLTYLCGYNGGQKGARGLYIDKFLAFCVSNL